MATRRQPVSPHHAGILIALLALGGLTGCQLPGGRPARDALSPAEHLQLGAAYEHEGKTDLALREYERAATGDSAGAALTCQGNIYSARGDLATAETKYRAALAADPDNLFALNNLAWLLARQGRSLSEAEQLIRRALDLQPEPRAPYEDTLHTILGLK